jgi:hypothetical protein
MRHAVAATDREVKELSAYQYVQLRCSSALQRMERQGRLKISPMDSWTFAGASRGCHLELLKWPREDRNQ